MAPIGRKTSTIFPLPFVKEEFIIFMLHLQQKGLVIASNHFLRLTGQRLTSFARESLLCWKEK
ncbi:hypothetical protein LPAF129_17120 [Ligilactobacillus pabuli]|uniref:Uncharacterized protein n=1 Tax=Ligilactobacillus pabuli TaxID=2886039 RepID=A0ABQ5JIS6_9LACO|nr:hypothetical protein LPAF129_17120 [Ligilactobacillus pabuli]